MTTIDVHSHVIPSNVIEAMTADSTAFSARIEDENATKRLVFEQGFAHPLFDEFTSPETKLQAMDSKGLDISVLSPPPTFFYYWTEAERGARLARLMNDGIGQFVDTNPERFRGMATVPMQDTDAAIAELEHVVSAYGFRAVEVGASIEGEQLADPRFRPFLRRAAELDVLVFTHPYYNYYVGAAKQGLENYYLTNLIGNPYHTTVMIANLIFSGTLDELPDLKVCVAHAGGFAPYQIGRLEHGYQVRPETSAQVQTSPLELMRKLYFDTITFNTQALRYLIDLVGREHVVLGTDAPFDMRDDTPLKTVESVPNLSSEEQNAIFSEAASRLLGEKVT